MLKSICLGVGALVVGLAMTAPASAQGFGRSPYHARHGVRFGGGTYYRGQQHNHWGHRSWNARYGRYHYYDSHLRSNYYWDASRACYLPVRGFPGGGLPW